MTFALHVSAPGDVDGAIADLGAVRLERLDDRLTLTASSAAPAHVVAHLARAGIAATAAAPLDIADRPAVVDHLRPCAIASVHDVIEVRLASLGESVRIVRAATRDVLDRRRQERRERLAALLAGRERLLLWRRILYAPAVLLRTGRIAGAHPVVFDLRGVERARERVTPVSAGALSAWVRW